MQSLRSKLVDPFLVGTVVLTLLLTWYTYSSARQAVEDAMLLISEAKTNHVSSSLSLLFRSMSTNMQNMVVDPHVVGLFDSALTPAEEEEARGKLEDWLTIITQGNEFYRDIQVVNAEGVCIASSNTSEVGMSFLDRPHVRQALRGMTTISEASVGRVTRKFSASIAGPVDVGGRLVGALAMINDFPRIVDYDTTASHDNQTIFTVMIAPDGMFAAHKDKRLMGNEELLFPELYKQLAHVGEKGAPVRYLLEGRAYVGFAKVEPGSKWLVVTSGVESEVFAPAYKVGLTVLCLGIIFCMLIAFVVLQVANGVLGSLLSLIDYARRVSEGNLDLKLEATRRKDELGILHAALQRMVESLQLMLIKSEEAGNMKSQFLANMSHEIRTPLNAIIGMTHLSLRDGGLSEKQRGYLEKIRTAARSLLGVINDILDLSKVEAGMMQVEEVAFNLREVLENSMAIHQATAGGKALELRLDYQPGLEEHFFGDPLRIGQIINNLLSNAIKFTAAGGVSVRCALEKTSGMPETPDTTTAAAPGETKAGASGRGKAKESLLLRISVTDTGIGIPADRIAALFQPFTQADASTTRQFGGTGLGLTISDRLVRLMGGAFTVTSEVGEGTTFGFTLRLPVDATGAHRKAEEIPLDEAYRRLHLQGKRILVAEDNEINQMILQELLAPSGASVSLANNGLEAVNAVRAEPFDLVLMDMQMPVMGGMEATGAIRAFADAGALPIIAVTANAMKEEQERGLAGGMNGYLTKPVDPHQLLELLEQWLPGGKR